MAADLGGGDPERQLHPLADALLDEPGARHPHDVASGFTARNACVEQLAPGRALDRVEDAVRAASRTAARSTRRDRGTSISVTGSSGGPGARTSPPRAIRCGQYVKRPGRVVRPDDQARTDDRAGRSCATRSHIAFSSP
jgi:hypothetical protein